MDRLPREVEQVLYDDALECARRTKRYKFGRLSTARIVELLHRAASESGEHLDQSDEVLVQMWFSVYDDCFKELA